MLLTNIYIFIQIFRKGLDAYHMTPDDLPPDLLVLTINIGNNGIYAWILMILSSEFWKRKGSVILFLKDSTRTDMQIPSLQNINTTTQCWPEELEKCANANGMEFSSYRYTLAGSDEGKWAFVAKRPDGAKEIKASSKAFVWSEGTRDYIDIRQRLPTIMLAMGNDAKSDERLNWIPPQFRVSYQKVGDIFSTSSFDLVLIDDDIKEISDVQRIISHISSSFLFSEKLWWSFTNKEQDKILGICPNTGIPTHLVIDTMFTCHTDSPGGVLLVENVTNCKHTERRRFLANKPRNSAAQRKAQRETKECFQRAMADMEKQGGGKRPVVEKKNLAQGRADALASLHSREQEKTQVQKCSRGIRMKNRGNRTKMSTIRQKKKDGEEDDCEEEEESDDEEEDDCEEEEEDGCEDEEEGSDDEEKGTDGEEVNEIKFKTHFQGSSEQEEGEEGGNGLNNVDNLLADENGRKLLRTKLERLNHVEDLYEDAQGLEFLNYTGETLLTHTSSLSSSSSSSASSSSSSSSSSLSSSLCSSLSSSSSSSSSSLPQTEEVIADANSNFVEGDNGKFYYNVSNEDSMESTGEDFKVVINAQQLARLYKDGRLMGRVFSMIEEMEEAKANKKKARK
jgi:hypothetical protein